jgi:type IV pilus assembly protein PilW
MSQNDLMIAYETNTNGVLVKTCTLFQVSNADPVSTPINHNNGSWNGNAAIFPASDYTTDALLINMGTLMVRYYSLDAESNLVTREYDSATNSGLDVVNDPAQILSSDVVNLQAQYGFDTRSAATILAACPPNTGSGQCSIVDTWNDNMMDADASGTTGDAGDIARIYAVRFAVVARSGLKEKPDQVTGVCNVTTAGPTWAGGTIDVSKNPDGTPNADWKCYRYKTFETTVPLRNAIWKQR